MGKRSKNILTGIHTQATVRFGESSRRHPTPHKKYENIGYVEVPDDHLYQKQNSERSDEVSRYVMVTRVQVPVRKLLLLLLFSLYYCGLGESISR